MRLPEDFQFTTSEVFIRREGDEIILSSRPATWDSFLAGSPVASEDFMNNVEDLPLQKREFWCRCICSTPTPRRTS